MEKDAIEDAAQKMLKNNVAIFKTKQIVDALKEEQDLEVGRQKVAKSLRKDLHFGYRVVKTVPIQSNNERCLVLRQQYAL